MKKILIIVFTVLCLFKTNVVFSENTILLDDFANLIEDEYEEELKSQAQLISDRYNIDLVILTVDSCPSSLQSYADDYYDERFYNQDGFIFAINISEREIYLSGVGSAIDAISDYEIDEIIDTSRNYLSNDEFSKAFKQMLDSFDYYYSYDDIEEIDEYYTEHNSSKNNEFGLVNILISALFGLAASLITGIALKRQLKSVEPKLSANDYGTNLQVTGMSDFFLGSHVTRSRIHHDDNNISSHSSHSTHISSSGVTHSGHSSHF